MSQKILVKFCPVIFWAVASTAIADDPIPSYLGNASSSDSSFLTTANQWSGGVVPIGGDWKTDETLRALSNLQSRLTTDMSFNNFSHEASDLEVNSRFEILASVSGTYGISFNSVSLTAGAIPFGLTNNNGVGSFTVAENLSVDSEMRIGRPTAAASGNVSAFGSVSVGETTTLGAAGMISLSRTVGTVHLGNLEINGGTLELTMGSGSNGSSTTEENTITVNRLHGATGLITTAKASTAGQLIVDGTVDGTFGGTIVNGSGVVRLTKAGVGTLTLTNVNTYTGVTTILGGELALGAGGSISNSSAFDIHAGATLSKLGTLAVPGSVTIGIDGVSGQVVADILNISGDLIIDITGSYGQEQWLLFDFTSTSGSWDSVELTGSYSGSLLQDESIWSGTVNGQDWQFDQSSGYLTVIPEAKLTALLFAFSALALVVRRRKQTA